MALPQDINERHFEKYRDTASGVAVAVTNPDGSNVGAVVSGATFSLWYEDV